MEAREAALSVGGGFGGFGGFGGLVGGLPASSDMDKGVDGREELESDERDDGDEESGDGDGRGNGDGGGDGGGEGAEGLGTDWARSSARRAKRAAVAEGVVFRGRKQPSGPRDRLVFEFEGMVPAEKRNLESEGLTSSM